MRISDWSSDVCSSDLLAAQVIAVRRLVLLEFLEGQRDLLARGGDRAVDLGDGTLDLAAPVERGLDEGGQRDAGDRRAVGRLLLTRELGLQGLDVIEPLGPEPFQLGQLLTLCVEGPAVRLTHMFKSSQR